jgi:uncharacterized membrane protein YfcA
MAVMVVAAAVQGSVGFGANVLAVPLLLMLDDHLVPGPAILAGFGLNLLMLWRDRHAISLRPVSSALLGRVAGTAVGVAAVGAISQRGLAVVVALTVLAVVAVSLVGFSARRTMPNLLAAGVVSGFSSSTAGIGGPPLAVLYADAGGPEIRGSMGAFFVVGNVISLTGLALGGLLGAEEIRLGLALVPAAMVGFAGSRWIVPVLDRGHARAAILAVSTLAALGLLVRIAVA